MNSDLVHAQPPQEAGLHFNPLEIRDRAVADLGTDLVVVVDQVIKSDVARAFHMDD